ncbi:glycoside hydrolase family 15 protein [Rhodococcus sp. NPDC127528]|uniref:glycoside hydrolase family 15 protein n=1 Tax=unclassified Rhodococcus (in: high G+C Gram-positive bacteria) TaxID=192944 RepID=UPI00363DBD59
MSDFPAIADYAFLSDCHTNALVAPNGSVEWMCVPRPDSPSVFGAMLDRSAGFFRLAPANMTTPSQRRYLPGSLVLETTWCTPTGCLVVRDALVMAPWPGGPRVAGHRRPPGDFVGLATLVRTAVCVEGRVETTTNCLPLFDYGRAVGKWEYTGEDYGSARCRGDGHHPDLTLTSNMRLGLGGARAGSRTDLDAGESAFVALSWGPSAPATVEEAVEQIDTTERLSRAWLRHASLPDHRWRPYLERSALTLKGLTFAPSGAIMAAATTSLPETPGGERNWDYRYSWLRDSSFILHALFELGHDWEAFEYFAFLIDALAGGPLQIMYGIDTERDLTERTLDHLSGYDGARPVRVGNGAWNQQQHDMWGMALESIATHVKHASQIGPPAWALVTQLVEGAAEAWREPDCGIWEIRGEPQHFTASKVQCWVALDRGAKLADDRGDAEHARRWRETAEEIHADVCANGVDERGVFVQHYGSTTLDAATLLLPLMGFLPPEDERVRATVLAIERELTENGLVLRYRTGETDDGLSGAEGTFVICSFWLVTALTMIGETERAAALCDRLLSLASPLGLYAEEIDATTGTHLGNFPQAFTHLALIDAVTRVIKAEEDRGRAPRG